MTLEDMDNDRSTTHIGLDGSSICQMLKELDNDDESDDEYPRSTASGVITEKYAPTFNIFLLYSRLSKKYKRFFAMDSIAVLQTVAQHVNHQRPVNLFRCGLQTAPSRT